MACHVTGMPEADLKRDMDGSSDTVDVWEPSLLRQRMTEEVVADWLTNPSLGSLETGGETAAHGKLPSISRQGNVDIRSSPQTVGRGYGSPATNRIPTRIRTAQVESTVRLRGQMDMKKPMTSPVTSENVPPKALGAWGASKESSMIHQHRRTVATPLIPVDTKADMSNVEFTGSSFVTTEFPTRRPVDRIETVQLNALLDRMVEDVQTKAKSISQSEVMEQLRKVHDAVSKEVSRQVSVHCMDQGMLVERCLQFYTAQVEQLPELFIKPLETKMGKLRTKYQETKTELDEWRCKHQDLEKRFKKSRESEANERMLKQQAESKVLDLENEVNLLNEKIAGLQKNLEKAKDNYKRERDQREILDDKLLKLTKKLERMQDAHSKLLAHYEALKIEKSEMGRNLGEALDARQTAIALLDCEKVARRRLDEEVKDLTEYVAELEAKLQKAELDLREAKQAQVKAELEAEKNKRELDEALDRVAKMRQEHDNLVKEHKQVQDELRETKEILKIESGENARRKAELEAEIAANEELSTKLKETTSLLKERQAELARTQKELADRERMMGTADEDIAALKKQVNCLSMTCADLQGHWLNEVNKRTALEKTVDGYEERIKRASEEKEHQIDFLNIKIKMMAKEIEQFDEKLLLSNQKLQVADERLASLEKELEVADKRIAQFDIEMVGYKKKISKLESTLQQQQQETQQLKEENYELQQAVSTMENRMKEAARHLEDMRHKYNAEHFMRVALETRYKALQGHMDDLKEEGEQAKEDMANLEKRLEQQIRELQEEVVREQTLVSDLAEQKIEAERAWVEQRQKAEHDHESAMIKFSQQAAADKQGMIDSKDAEFNQLRQGMEDAWQAEKIELQKIIEDARFRPARAALGTQMTPPPTPPTFGNLSTQMTPMPTPLPTPMPTPLPTPMPTPPSTSHSSVRPAETSVHSSSTQWSKPSTPQLPPQLPPQMPPMLASKPATPVAGLDAVNVTSRSTQVSRTSTPQLEKQEDAPNCVPTPQELKLNSEVDHTSRCSTAVLKPTTPAEVSQNDDVLPQDDDLPADSSLAVVDMDHPAWNRSAPTIDERPVSVWTDEASQSETLECIAPVQTQPNAHCETQFPSHEPTPVATPLVRSRVATPATPLLATPGQQLTDRATTPVSQRAGAPGVTPAVSQRGVATAMTPAATPAVSQRGVTPAMTPAATPAVSQRGVTPAATPAATPAVSQRGVTPVSVHSSVPNSAGSVLPDTQPVTRPPSLGARPPSTWTDGLMDSSSYLTDATEQIPVISSWDASDAIDYAADGLRVVAQAIHESCDSKEDSKSMLHQCLNTVVKACNEIRNAQHRLKTPGSSRLPTPVGRVDRPGSARVIALDEECPLCRMIQSDDSCSSDREVTITGRRSTPSTAPVQIEPQAPIVPLKPPQRYNKEESSAFSSWLVSQGMPTMHPLQQEGLMHILHAVQEQLMDGIETLESEITEVVSRYIPEEAVNIAKVTGGEIKSELQHFKDRVRQTMSFECCNFLREEKKPDSKKSKEFGQVAFLKCDCAHNTHVWMYDEDAISKHGAVGLKCMFMASEKRFA